MAQKGRVHTQTSGGRSATPDPFLHVPESRTTNPALRAPRTRTDRTVTHKDKRSEHGTRLVHTHVATQCSRHAHIPQSTPTRSISHVKHHGEPPSNCRQLQGLRTLHMAEASTGQVGHSHSHALRRTRARARHSYTFGSEHPAGSSDSTGPHRRESGGARAVVKRFGPRSRPRDHCRYHCRYHRRDHRRYHRARTPVPTTRRHRAAHPRPP